MLILHFILDNWQGILAVIATVGHMFPTKTLVNKAADAVIANPAFTDVIKAKVSDYAGLNK